MRKLVMTIILVLWTAFQAYASFRLPPGKYEAISENGKYKVTVTAPEKKTKTKSQISVFTKNDNKWEHKWKVTPVNAVRPFKTYITNNGLFVVTTGNWYGNDEGSDELVVYKEGKLLKQYSLNKLLGGHFEPEYYAMPGPTWLCNSFNFFDNNKRFCMWTDAYRKWIVVNLADGHVVELDKKDQNKYEARIRRLAYEEIKNGENLFDNYRKLARFLRPEDKVVFEKLLICPDENIGCLYISKDSDIHYASRSQYRELAEMALNTLDMKDKDNKRLGSIDISAMFEQAPKKGDGVIILWLEALNKNGDAAVKERPADILGISLMAEYSFPHESGKAGTSLKIPVKMVMDCVIPGKYRICGYWKKDIKHLEDIEKDFWKQTGDYIIQNGPIVDVKKGERTKPIHISFKKNKV